MDNLCIIGFMGAGKSSVSQEISNQSGFKFIELDEMIEKRTGMSIPDIFNQHGEAYFRNMETAVLTQLASEKHAVFSCGGGIVLKEENVKLLKSIGFIVWLKATPQTIYRRIGNDTGRPLLKGNMSVAYIGTLLKEREEKYRQAAMGTVETDNLTIAQVAASICRRHGIQPLS